MKTTASSTSAPEVKFWHKLRALDGSAKHFGLLVQKVEHAWPRRSGAAVTRRG
jgi:hypothetical protein